MKNCTVGLCETAAGLRFIIAKRRLLKIYQKFRLVDACTSGQRQKPLARDDFPRHPMFGRLGSSPGKFKIPASRPTGK